MIQSETRISFILWLKSLVIRKLQNSPINQKYGLIKEDYLQSMQSCKVNGKYNQLCHDSMVKILDNDAHLENGETRPLKQRDALDLAIQQRTQRGKTRKPIKRVVSCI